MKNALYLMLMVCFAVTVGCGGGEEKGKEKAKPADDGGTKKDAMVQPAGADVVKSVSFTTEGCIS